MDLFIDATVPFEKSAAAEVSLPEDPNSWGNEILQELYKQAPYVADFDPEVTLTQVDGERGFGFGYILVGNRTELPPTAPAASLEAAGVKQVRVPIVIRDIKLQPLDLLVTAEGNTLPLTETRLREALFRPQTFDMTARTPGDTSLISQLYPPFRQSAGGVAGLALPADMGKLGSAGSAGSALEVVLQTVLPAHRMAFLEAAGDPALQPALLKNAAALAPAVAKILAAEPVDIEKNGAALPHVVLASVAQIAKETEGYSVKTASHLLWAPVTQHVDRGELVARFGGKVALAADVNGGVTIAEGAEAGPEDAGPAPEPIKDFGVYRVQDEQGRDLVGYVFPNLLDLDGRRVPLALFTNGSQSAVQADIAGVRVGDAVPVHEARPRGYGAFVTMDSGEAEAALPIEIRGTFNGEEGVTFQGETMDGNVVEIRQQPNIQQLQFIEGVMLVPDHYRWLSLEGSEKVVLASTPEEVGKEARALAAARTVVLRGDGNCFSVDGLPVAKLAADERHFLGFDDALFLLAGLGVDLQHAQHKLAAAGLGHRPIEVRVGREIKTASEQMQQARAVASELLAALPDLRRELFKEAAVIPDPVAVDTVLSLGFINPENTDHLIRSMPKVEEGQRRMCELLLAARLGLKEIPVYALERAIHSTEEVLEGLKVLAFQKN